MKYVVNVSFFCDFCAVVNDDDAGEDRARKIVLD